MKYTESMLYRENLLDKYGNKLSIVDIVAFNNYGTPEIGIIHHFAAETVIIRYYYKYKSGDKYLYKAQRYHYSLIKVGDYKDENKYEDIKQLIEDLPKEVLLKLKDYGKESLYSMA